MKKLNILLADVDYPSPKENFKKFIGSSISEVQRAHSYSVSAGSNLQFIGGFLDLKKSKICGITERYCHEVLSSNREINPVIARRMWLENSVCAFPAL